MVTLKFFSKLIKVLTSADNPNQIAVGFVLGMFLGFTPIFTLHNLIIILLLILLNINGAMAIFGFIVFSGIAYLLDPLFHSIGYFLLVDVQSLQGLWTAMYNTPILALSHYNNTVVMGGLVISLVAAFPLFYLTRQFILFYQRTLYARVQKLKIVRMVQGSSIYSWYRRVKEFRG